MKQPVSLPRVWDKVEWERANQGSLPTLGLDLEGWVKVCHANKRRKAIPTRGIDNANTTAFADKAVDTASFTSLFLQ